TGLVVRAIEDLFSELLFSLRLLMEVLAVRRVSEPHRRLEGEFRISLLAELQPRKFRLCHRVLSEPLLSGKGAGSGELLSALTHGICDCDGVAGVSPLVDDVHATRRIAGRLGQVTAVRVRAARL